MEQVDDVFREEWSTVLAVLVRLLGDFHLAEEAAQDAFTAAAEHWAREGLPSNPRAWLITTGRRKAIDRLRRSRRVLPMAQPVAAEAAYDIEEDWLTGSLSDEQLALVFTCCHPALAREAQVALTLRAVGGLGTREIAEAFLVPEQTMRKRLTRAKAKIRDAGIALTVPPESALVDRLAEVLVVVYLIYNAGYRGARDTSAEAIRLGRLLATLMPDESEVAGLLALMLLQESRRRAREIDGVLIPLPAQDRALWNKDLIAEALELLSRHRGPAGFYLLQARIAAAYVHPVVPWAHVLDLYDQLLAVADSPVVRINRAVVEAEVHGAQAAIDALDSTPLPHYLWWHSTRAEMLRRLDRPTEAAAAYRDALQRSSRVPESAFLNRRIVEMEGRVPKGGSPAG